MIHLKAEKDRMIQIIRSMISSMPVDALYSDYSEYLDRTCCFSTLLVVLVFGDLFCLRLDLILYVG